MYVLINKIRSKIWYYIVSSTVKTPLYFALYRSFWYAYFFGNKGKRISELNYFAATPNRGAGIGHQLANWIAGYWYAEKLDLQFAHIPFSNSDWEHFLGFGENEQLAQELVEISGFEKVKIPLFNESNDRDLYVIKKIIKAYSGKRVVFICEQDQPYIDQYGVMEKIRNKFFNSSARKTDQLIYSKGQFNIAIHVRRGDIVNSNKNNPNLTMRWQDNSYFENVLSNVLSSIKISKPIAIYIFSQGDVDEFSNFNKFGNVVFCLDMNAKESFLHMVYADLLITSKSSFSYKPALLNKGIKVCPKDFWHSYPVTSDWILAEEDGSLPTLSLIKTC